MKKFLIFLTVLILTPLAFCASANDYIFPTSDSEKIPLSTLASFDIKTIEIAKNEIYARHGLVFQDAAANEYFKQKSWYKVDKNFKKDTLNYFEASNARLLESILRNPKMLEDEKKAKPPASDDKKISQDVQEELAVKSKDEDIAQRVRESVSAKKPNVQKSNTKGDAIVATARKGLGVRYKFGGTSPQTGFDCSGFVGWVFGQHGIKTARSTPDLRKNGVRVPPKELKPGDIVIVSNRRGRDSPNGLHAGIYVGGGAMIHAPGRGRSVIQIKMTYLNVLEGRRLTK